MMISTMARNAFRKTLIGFSIFIFWIAVWDLLAFWVNNLFLLPTPYSTAIALLSLMKTKTFYKVIVYTFLRVVFGVIFGVIFGAVFAFLSYKVVLIRKLFSPLVSIVKATPVVTFITLLWISMSGNMLTIFIAFLMVVPIIWQNLLNGFDAIPRELSEVCDVFEVSKIKRMKILTLPILMNYFFPALITSIGLAWKAEIATEIITYTHNSIGQNISDARYFLFTDEVFAWVVVIITFSIGLEVLTKQILGRFKR